MTTLIAHPESKEKLAAKAAMKALEISFEEEKPPYNTKFVASILQAEKDIKDGKGVGSSLCSKGN